MINDKLDQDSYGEVFNSNKTFAGIADIVTRHTSVIIGWTDNAGSHLDVMFTVQPIQAGSLQRGMRANTDLFVSVSHFGMFGFTIETEPLFPGYVGEKLRTGENNETTLALTELINGVKALL